MHLPLEALTSLLLLSATPALATPILIHEPRHQLTSTNTTSILIERAHRPHPPRGANLIRLQPCPSSHGTVPTFVSSSSWPQPNKPPSQATTAYISQHGSEVDPASYFSYVHDIVGDHDAVVIAPGFDRSKATEAWYEKGKTMTWGPGREADEHTWAGGFGSTTPHGGSAPPCSSFQVYNHILSRLTDRNRFPKLQTIVWTGHSAGGGMVQRWSVVAPEPQGYRTRYIVSNAATTAGYFGDDVRPMPYDGSACPGAKRYPFAWTLDGMPPYVAELNGGVGPEEAFRRWARRDVTMLVGDFDTHKRWPQGTQSCEARSQGGENRRERNYGAWAYSVLKAGVKGGEGFTGFDHMKASGVRAVPGVIAAPSAHKMCVVDGVGHDGAAMYRSACGKEALFGHGAVASVGAKYP